MRTMWIVILTAVISLTGLRMASAASERPLTGALIGAGTGALLAGPAGAFAGGVVGGVVGGPRFPRFYRECWQNRFGERRCHWR